MKVWNLISAILMADEESKLNWFFLQKGFATRDNFVKRDFPNLASVHQLQITIKQFNNVVK